MIGRRLLILAILVAAALNTGWGLVRIAGFLDTFRGDRALAAGQLDSALSHLRKAVVWQPGDSAPWIMIGRVVQRAQANGLPLEPLEGDTPAEVLAVGITAVTHGIASSPADPWGWFNLGDLYQGFRAARIRHELMRRAGEAAGGRSAPPASGPQEPGLDLEVALTVAATLKAMELEPEFFYYDDYLARLYWRVGLREQAAIHARESFASWPRLQAHPSLEDPEILKGLGDAMLEGIENARSNPFVEPLTIERGRANLLEKLGRTEESIAAYRALRVTDGPLVEAECDLAIGKLEQRLGRHRESIAPLSAAAQSEGAEVTRDAALYYLGAAHAALGDHEKAVEQFEEYLRRRPDTQAAYHALAREMEALGRLDEAETLYVAAVRRFPDQPATYRRTIEHLRGKGKLEEALAYAEALGKVDPEDETTASLIEELRRAGSGGR